jgi:hypothetical protein
MQKKISTSSMACGNFGQKRENAFFGLISKFNFRSPKTGFKIYLFAKFEK